MSVHLIQSVLNYLGELDEHRESDRKDSINRLDYAKRYDNYDDISEHEVDIAYLNGEIGMIESVVSAFKFSNHGTYQSVGNKRYGRYVPAGFEFKYSGSDEVLVLRTDGVELSNSFDMRDSWGIELSLFERDYVKDWEIEWDDPVWDTCDFACRKVATVTAFQAITSGKVKTLEGVVDYSEGDWIVEDQSGNVWPVKPEVFEKTYKLVELTDWS